MPKPKNNLKALLENETPVKEPEIVEAEPVKKDNKSQRCPSRQGKKLVSGYFDPEAHKQLKLLSLETDKPIQALLTDALNALFKMHDKPPIA